MGFHNEQGGKSLHNKFNQLQRQFASIRDSLNQLMLMLREHHIQIMATKDLLEEPPKRSLSISNSTHIMFFPIYRYNMWCMVTLINLKSS